MYSPKIDEALIPRIYRAAKAAKIPMTTWVNRAVEGALSQPSAAPPSQPLTILDGVGAHEASAAQKCQVPLNLRVPTQEQSLCSFCISRSRPTPKVASSGNNARLFSPSPHDMIVALQGSLTN